MNNLLTVERDDTLSNNRLCMLIDLVDNVMRYSNPLTQQNYCLQVHVRCLFEHSPMTTYMYMDFVQ